MNLLSFVNWTWHQRQIWLLLCFLESANYVSLFTETDPIYVCVFRKSLGVNEACIWPVSVSQWHVHGLAEAILETLLTPVLPCTKRVGCWYHMPHPPFLVYRPISWYRISFMLSTLCWETQNTSDQLWFLSQLRAARPWVLRTCGQSAKSWGQFRSLLFADFQADCSL